MNFPTTSELSQRARERVARPVIVAGVTFVSTSEAACVTGWSTAHLRRWTCGVAGPDGVPLTLDNGVRFVRVARHKGDERAPVYFDVQSIPPRANAVTWKR